MNTSFLGLYQSAIKCIPYSVFHVPIKMGPWSIKAVLSHWCMFIVIAKNTLNGSKLYIFNFMPKIIRILRSCSMKTFCKFPIINISKLNFLLVIWIAKNLIWTTLKMIFSIFRFFCTLRFQIFKSLYLNQILSKPVLPKLWAVARLNQHI